MIIDCPTFSTFNMRHLLYIILLLVLPSCGGQLYKTFKPSADEGAVMFVDSLSKGQMFVLRIAEQYDKIQTMEVIHGDSTVIQEEVPVKVYRNVSDTGIRFLPDDSSPKSTNDVFLHDVVGTNFMWFTDIDKVSGRVYVMSALRVFPTPLKPSVRLKKKQAALEYQERELRAKLNLKDSARDRRRLKRNETVALEVKSDLLKLRTSMRSAVIRRKMCDNDSLDWALIDQIWVGHWSKLANTNLLEVHVPIQGPYSRNWFEMSVKLDEKGVLCVDSISNPTADRLTTQAMPSKTRISVDDCIRISGTPKGLSYFPDNRRSVLTWYERKLFRVNYSHRARPLSSAGVKTIEVVANGKKNFVRLVTESGKYVKKSRVRVI
jgi:hypothetical protein